MQWFDSRHNEYTISIEELRALVNEWKEGR